MLRVSVRALLVVLALACSADPEAGPAKGPPKGKSGPSGPSGPAAVAAAGKKPVGPNTIPMERSVDEAVVAATLKAAEAATAGLATCRAGPIGQALPEVVQAQGFPFGTAEIEATCGVVRSLYEVHFEALAGRSRSADVLLMAFSRTAEDFRFLEQGLGQTDALQRRGLIEHVHGALEQLDRALVDMVKSPRQTYALVFQPKEGVDPSWRQPLEGDRWSTGGLAQAFEQLAFRQGFDPTYVRGRMLASFLRIARGEVKARQKALAEAGERVEASELATRAAYLATLDAAVTTWEEVLATYTAGKVTDVATRDALIARATAADQAWRSAWRVERVRVGLPADPEAAEAAAPAEAPVNP